MSPPTSSPLNGQCVLVTRPGRQAANLVDRLTGLGAEVLLQPAIEIAPPGDWKAVDEALHHLDQYDWLVFSSTNGVQFFWNRYREVLGERVCPGGIKFAAIGPGTAEELGRRGLRVDLVPEKYRAESLAEALAAEAAGRRFLLARASRGRRVLAETLIAAGGNVDEVVVYVSRDVSQSDPEIREALAAGRIDWVTVTSSAIARSLVKMFGEDLHQTRLASISPVTSGVLKEQGHEPAVEASTYTMEGIVAAILSPGKR